MKHEYRTRGTCAQIIRFELDGDTVRDIEFYGGCNGNLKALSKLLESKTVDYIEETLLGNDCGGRGTSCADQLAKAVRAAHEKENKND